MKPFIHIFSGIVTAYPHPQPRVNEDVNEPPKEESKHPVTSLQTAATDLNASTVFIENVGQFEEQVKYASHINGATVYFSEKAIWYLRLETIEKKKDREIDPSAEMEERLSPRASRKGTSVKLDFPGGSQNVTIEPGAKVETTLSYFLGAEEDQQHTRVPAWGKLIYKKIYPGINLEITGKDGSRLVTVEEVKTAFIKLC